MKTERNLASRDTALVVACPTCRAPVSWTPENSWRPFCSRRCRTLDLGAWASESYRIPDSTSPDPEADISL